MTGLVEVLRQEHRNIESLLVRRGVLKGGPMSMYNMKGRAMAQNIWAQLGLLAAATVVLIVLASRYVW
jgi:hypothetical protein